MYRGAFDTSDWPSHVRDRGLEEFQDPDPANATMKQIVVGCSLSIARLFERSSSTRQAAGPEIQVGQWCLRMMTDTDASECGGVRSARTCATINSVMGMGGKAPEEGQRFCAGHGPIPFKQD